MRLSDTRLLVAGVVLICVGAVRAADQVWSDTLSDNTWSTNALTWDAGSVWVNGNNAIFNGNGGLSQGETIEISNDVRVANITFQTNGYVIADADTNGTLTFVGTPSLVTVAPSNSAATISEVIAGSVGFIKAGNGVLNLTATNTYTGTTIVSNGTLRLGSTIAQGLGATGAGNDTVVAAGATLDFNGCYVTTTSAEKFTIAGSGVDGKGVLVNKGPGHTNRDLAGVILQDDAVIGGPNRIDVGGLTGNNKKLTKVGTSQLCMKALSNAEIVINEGMFTILADPNGLGGTSWGNTTVNGGTLDCWNTYSIPERITFNGGSLSQGNISNNFIMTGYLTVNSNVTANSGVDRGVEISGFVDGPGGFTQAGDGWLYLTCDTNAYTGPTVINSGKTLRVGKTLGGTGRLGAGAVTNNGTLHANSAVIGLGDVVNNGSLYLNLSSLSAGRIVNLGTVYGTSVVQTTRSVVNSGTWQCYSGSFGSSIVTNASGGTLNLYTNILVYGQFVNGGTLNILQPMTLSTPVTLSGGTIAVSSNSLLLTGPVTVNGNTTINSTSTGAVEISVAITGTGGFTQNGDGPLYLTSDANAYSGPTIINGGKTLVVGKTLGATGSLGSGSVTNWGTLYANSLQLCSGNVYNSGTLYWNNGLLSGAGAIVNNGNLYIDRGGAFVCSNVFSGSGGGATHLRYNTAMTVSGSASTNGNSFRIGSGSLTLTNNAFYRFTGEMQVADRYEYSPADPTNVVGIINVPDGCTLMAQAITFGNGNNAIAGGSMTGILNQTGGTVYTTGKDGGGEGNGIRLGHYPQASCVYNMMGGTLIVGADADLGCATDGSGWFKMTGGEVFATRVMLNERDSTGGFGRLSVSGGVMNLGSLSGLVQAVSNGIAADKTAPYLVEFGGSGGVIRAVTNIYSSLNATLYGTNANAITFDTTNCAINLSGNLTGAGGLNKTGSGTLFLTGTNTYSGGTTIKEGVLTIAARTNMPNGVLKFGVSASGASGSLNATGDLSLTGLSVGVDNPELLDKNQRYTVITYSGAVSGTPDKSLLPTPWYLYYDWANKAIKLRASVGTLIRLY
jgi:autotransporter-associated beta strand protein